MRVNCTSHQALLLQGDMATTNLVSTYGQGYAAGIGGQPYAAETPTSTGFGQSTGMARQDGSYLTDVFDRK